MYMATIDVDNISITKRLLQIKKVYKKKNYCDSYRDWELIRTQRR